MKKILTPFLILLLTSVTAQATKYEINVGGVEVTSDNANNVTGKDITVTEGCSSGYVTYVASSNTLILNNITINRTGSGDYAIHNRKCDDLTIRFRGKCYFSSEKAPTLKLQRNTTLNIYHGTTHIDGNYTNKKAAIDIEDNTLTFTGMSDADIYIDGGDPYSGCIVSTKKCFVTFQGGRVHINMDKPSSYTGSVNGLYNLFFYFEKNCDVHVRGEDMAFYGCTFSFRDKAAILSPYGGTTNSSGGISANNQTARSAYISSDYVAIINETYFPDANFRDYLLSAYSKGYITSSDVESRTSFLYMNNKSIRDLTGIQYFTNLEQLDCSKNYIGSTLDLTKLTKLTYLHCENNSIYTLTLPASIKTLVCSDNSLSSLSLTAQTNLETLYCDNNYLTSMDVSKCSKLWSISCNNNKFTSLQVNGLAGLNVLYCDDNKKLTSLTCDNNPYLWKLSVKNCTALNTLNCNNNNINELYLTGCSNLERLDCSENYLWGVSTLGDCTSLKYLKCSNNRIYGTDMTRLVNNLPTLPSNWTGNLLVIGSGNEMNEITDAQIKIARDKRWLPKKYVNGSWVEITTKGDVNGDGKVNVSDVTTLINMILGVTPMDEARADVNGDGKVNVSDVTALINIILA